VYNLTYNEGIDFVRKIEDDRDRDLGEIDVPLQVEMRVI
jgi:hypothetical protein